MTDKHKLLAYVLGTVSGVIVFMVIFFILQWVCRSCPVLDRDQSLMSYILFILIGITFSLFGTYEGIKKADKWGISVIPMQFAVSAMGGALFGVLVYLFLYLFVPLGSLVGG